MPRYAARSPMEFAGRTSKERTSRYVALAHTTYEEPGHQPRHGHVPAYLSAVLEGGYDETLGRSTVSEQKGSFIFHPAGEEHAVDFTAPRTRIFRVLIREELQAIGAELGLDLARPGRAVSAETRWVIDRMLREFERDDPVSPLAVDGLACELVAELARAAAGVRPEIAPDAAALARDWMIEHFSERASLATIAALIGRHPVTIAKSFRARFGCSVGGYLRRLRVEYASRRLVETDDPIARIALDAGFTDQGHLTRLFSRELGVTPAAYRRMRRLTNPTHVQRGRVVQEGHRARG